MVTTSELYAWKIDRDSRFVRIEDAPYDDEGNELVLFNGSDISDGTKINVVRPKEGIAADFLYDQGLLMYASDRAAAIIRSFNVPHARFYPLTLRDRRGHVVDGRYQWINVLPIVPLLDRDASNYTLTPFGSIRSVEKFVVRDSAVPPDDLFLAQEISTPIFKKPVVQAILSASLQGAVFEQLKEFRWP